MLDKRQTGTNLARMENLQTPSSAGIEILPTDAALGAEVRGVDIAHIDARAFEIVRRAWYDHLVLVFRNQEVTDDQHIAFSCRFGELDDAPINKLGRPWLPQQPKVNVISNIVESGAPIGALGAGEAIWHTDMSYRREPPAAAILRAIEVPDTGGDTWFANMYAAYDALSPTMKERAARLRVLHDSSLDSTGERRKGAPPVADPREAPGARHPMVRRHPITGRFALYLGRRRNAFIIGVDLAESERLLDELWAHATQPEFVWAHRWRAGDVVMWDNRCTVHRRDAFDDTLRRRMHRTQVRGEAVTGWIGEPD